MKHLYILLILFLFFIKIPLHAQCLEITGILINACDATSDETDNEMLTFTVGSNALNVSDINVNWPNVTFQGFCTSPSSTAALNATITNGCGYLLEPPGGVIPANANVILITSTNVSTVDNTFQGLSDTLYVVYQCDGNNVAQFVNQDTSSPTTRTTYFSITGPCTQIETVTYDGALLHNIDGERVYFDAAGVATYDTTQGCTAPVNNYSIGWSFSDEICNTNTNIDLTSLLSPGTTSGGTWTGPRVSGTTYSPGTYLGLDSITYTVSGSTSCATVLDSTIVFTVIAPNTGNDTIEFCDSTSIGGTWFYSDTTFTDTIYNNTLYSCDSLVDYVLKLTPLQQDSTYIFACDSVEINGLWFSEDTVLLDTVSNTTSITVIDTILATSFEDSEGWTDQATGNWTQIDTYGTWSANDMYANQYNPNNGVRNIGMNDVGDWIQFPAVDNPETLYYYDRLSAAANNINEYTIQYYDGTNWITIAVDTCTHVNYELVTIDLSIISNLTNVSIRILRTQDDRSGYIDDIVISSSSSALANSCDSLYITNVDIAEPTIFDTIYTCTNDPSQAITINDTIRYNNSCDSLITSTVTTLLTPTPVFTYACTINPSLVLNDTTSIITSSLGCDSIYNITSTVLVDTTSNDTTISSCNPILYNGNTYSNDTMFADTILSSLSCDSIYNIVRINITQDDTIYNPSVITICSTNDSALLNDGTYAYTAGAYPISYSRTGNCDSVYITTVRTELCNTTCTFDTLNFEGFEYDTFIDGVDTSTIFGNGTPNGQTSGNTIFIGKQHSGTRFAYFNFKVAAGSIFYSKQINTCPGNDIRLSFWHRQYGTNLSSNITVNIYDGPDNTYPLIATTTFTSSSTTYQQIVTSVYTPSSNIFTMEMIDNVGGPVGGNDLLLDDILFEYCALDTIYLNQDYCAFNDTFNLFELVSGGINNDGTWTGPSALTNGYLGTFDPANNIDGDYIYSNASTSCSDTTFVITTNYIPPTPTITSLTNCDSLYFNSEWYYTDTLISDTVFSSNSNQCDSIHQTIIDVTYNDTINTPIISFCNGDSITLPDGTVVDTSGVYTTILPKLTSNCDSVIITTVMSISCNCYYNLGNDTTFCSEDSLVLDAGTNAISYLWQDNSTNQTFTVNSTGTYYCTKTTLDLNDNVVLNGDFESGNVDFTSDYNYSSTAAPVTCASGNQSYGLLGCEGTYAVLTNPNAGHTNFYSCSDHTTGTGNMLVVNGSNTANTNVWCQTINVIPNTDYLFSAWVTSLENTNVSNVATLHFLIDGIQFGNDFSPSVTACNWQEFSTTWNSGSNTTIQICIESDVISGNNDYAIDDIFFTPTCIYTDTINVTVDSTPQFDFGIDQTICFGDSVILDASFPNADYLWQDASTDSIFTVTNSGTYWATANVNSCFYSDTVTITERSLILGDTIIVEECAVTYTLPGLNQIISADGLYNDTLTSSTNCDSIQPYNITFLTVDTGLIDTFICEGESFTLSDGTIVNTTGTYLSNAGLAQNSCDSFLTTNLTVRPIIISPAIIIEECADTFVIPNSGLVVSSNGIYNDTLVGNNTCDSIQPYDVTFLPNYTKTVNVSICMGDSFQLAGTNQFVSTAGTYTSDIVIANDCDTTVTTILSVESPTITTTNDLTICLGESTDLTATGTPNILWNTGDTTNTITVSPINDTLFYAQGTNASGCLTEIDTVEIFVTYPITNVSIFTSDDEINSGEEVQIEVNADNVQNYSWSPISSSSNSIVDAPVVSTTYFVELSNFPCPSVLDSAYIFVRQTFIAIPTGFSPNGDGTNDLFQVINYEDFEEYTMQIYNRWGELIYSETDYAAAWDGTYKGRDLEIGTYTYVIEAKHKYTDQIFNEKGNITLIR